MRQFLFKAIDGKGKLVSGSSKADDVSDLTAILKGQGLFLMEASLAADEAKAAPSAPSASAPRAGGPAAAASTQAAPVPFAAKPDRRRPRVSVTEIGQLTTQLTVMIRSALPILDSLTLLAQQQTNAELKNVLFELSKNVRDGKPLSQSFGRHPELFDEVYISLLSAGEASGRLVEMLERVSKYLQFQIDIREKVRTALIYPLIVFCTASLVVSFLVLFIVPVFAEVFAQFDVPLPFATQMLLSISGFMRVAWLPLLLAIGGAAWWFSMWLDVPANDYKLQAFLLELPVVGVLIRNIAMTRALRTLGALVASGVPILQALELARASAGNVVFQRLLGKVQDNVVQGRGLALALKGSPYVPEGVVGMIETGERTGALPTVIEKVADFYEMQTETAVRNLFTLLEPLFVVVLGFMVGGVAVSILLPLFSLTSGVQ